MIKITFVWILTLFAGIVIGSVAIARLIPKTKNYVIISVRQLWFGLVLPTIIAPLIATSLNMNRMQVLVADYLMIHLAICGIIQITFLGVRKMVFTRINVLAVFIILLWGIFFFGFTVDRYAASFVPSLPRVYIILVLSFGTILVMVADAYVTDSGQGSFWVRLFARIALIPSLLAAAMIDPYDLTFIIIALLVFVLFFLSMVLWSAGLDEQQE